jgi:hypothetical protein
MNKEEIIKEIRSVFRIQPKPVSGNLVLGSSGEAVETKQIFINKDWTEINQSDIVQHNSALGFLSHEAFQYYLPAYMMLLLNDIIEADIVASNVVNQLTLPLEVDKLRLMNFLANSRNNYQELEDFLLEELRNSTDNVAYFIERMDGFTIEQGKCINNFLIGLDNIYPDYFDEGESIIASKRYWFKYSR